MSRFTEWLDSLRGEIPDYVREALDDLWCHLSPDEIEHLHPDTLALVKANHEYLWHRDEDEHEEA